MNMSTSPRIISLNLSSHGLTGKIVPQIQNLTELQILDLSNNKLTGRVPEFLANMKSLLFINISNNNLDGSIPRALLDRKKLQLYFEGNPKLCGLDTCKISSGNKQNKIIVPVASAVAIFIVVSVLIVVFIKKRPSSIQALHSATTSLSLEGKMRRISYSEIQLMTNNFERVIGEGGFGVVYHAYLDDRQQVAVKVLSPSSSQGYKQFKAEVELLLRVHHANLVSLVGYCDEQPHLALIYKYMTNGDLKAHLLGRHECCDGKYGECVLNWANRLRIAVEVALGLEYLHSGCKPPMVHRDVKSVNILLDEHLQAKLADFGLSRSFSIGDETHVSTGVVGTPGYLDPEYYKTHRLTEKSDVYSFGIVLLEMITNQPVIDQVNEYPHIAERVGTMLTRGDIKTIVDPDLNEEYDSGSLWKALELAMSCVNPYPVARPDMSHVVHELKECVKSENLRAGLSQVMESESSVDQGMSSDSGMTPNAR
ncbi:unnamed protein product [Brassica oleracea var. botrytis]